MDDLALPSPTDTKMLFSALIKALDLNCVCDIGSRDGNQAMLFRDVLPNATVIAFEANPINFRAMSARQALGDKRVEISPYAITNENGTATFFITDVDYDDPESNKGCSSLLSGGYASKQAVEVEIRRLDDFLLGTHPEASRIGLWIDVESAEYQTLEGIEKILERVLVVHVETALKPVRDGHKPFRELRQLMESRGFVICGAADFQAQNLGDVIFIQEKAIGELGFKFQLAQFRGRFSRFLPIHPIAAFLRDRFPSIYRPLRIAYLKLVTQ